MTLGETLAKANPGLRREALPEDCAAFLHAHGVPDVMTADLEDCAFDSYVEVASLCLSRMAELVAANSGDDTELCVDNGFVIVGSGLNGDPITVEVASGKVCFISHDLLYEGDFEEFDEVVVRTPLSFEQFWLAALNDKDFPRDSYDAVKRWPTENAG